MSCFHRLFNNELTVSYVNAKIRSSYTRIADCAVFSVDKSVTDETIGPESEEGTTIGPESEDDKTEGDCGV